MRKCTSYSVTWASEVFLMTRPFYPWTSMTKCRWQIFRCPCWQFDLHLRHRCYFVRLGAVFWLNIKHGQLSRWTKIRQWHSRSISNAFGPMEWWGSYNTNNHRRFLDPGLFLYKDNQLISHLNNHNWSVQPGLKYCYVIHCLQLIVFREWNAHFWGKSELMIPFATAIRSILSDTVLNILYAEN